MGRFLNADAFATTGQGLLGNNMFAYCLNNPVNYTDPGGKAAVIDDILVFSAVFVSVIALIVAPPSDVLDTVVRGINQIIAEIVEKIEHAANVLTAKTKGKERIKDTGLAQESDQEVQRKARDKSLPKSEQRRYQREEKARGFRNRRKRIEIYE